MHHLLTNYLEFFGKQFSLLRLQQIELNKASFTGVFVFYLNVSSY